MHIVSLVSFPVSESPRIKGDLSCVTANQLYASSTLHMSTVFMASDRQQPQFHLAVALPVKPTIVLNATQRKDFAFEVFSNRPHWPYGVWNRTIFMLSEGFSSALEGTSAQQGCWQTDRVLTQPLYPRGSALHLSHLADGLIPTDIQSASLHQGCSTGMWAVEGIKSKAWKLIFLISFLWS